MSLLLPVILFACFVFIVLGPIVYKMLSESAAKRLVEAVEGCGHCERGCGQTIRAALIDCQEQLQLATGAKSENL